MTSIISSISGYFSKSLILGTFLPVVVFLVLSALFLIPHLPADLTILVRFAALDKEWKALLVSFIAIVLSGLLYNLNIPILRFYEGYPWRSSLIGRFLTRRHQAIFDDALRRINAMRACRTLMESTSKDFASNEPMVKEFFEDWKALGSPLGKSYVPTARWLELWNAAETSESKPVLQQQWEAVTNDVITEYSRYRREIKANYPEERSLILPTRLGNVIRSFEYYPMREYRMDGIALWPRLVGVIPKDFAVAVDDAKTTFDFMMICSALSLVLGMSILLAGLIYPRPLSTRPLFAYWIAEVTVFLFLFYFFYRLSINRVGAWGSMVKSSFDLYRWELLKRLGYHAEPGTRKKEREIWAEISRQMIYGDRFDKVMQEYAAATPSYPSIQPDSAKEKIVITKGLKLSENGDVLTLCLRLKNKSDEEQKDVVLTEHLGDNFDYEMDSAKLDGQQASATGTNPYQFAIGTIAKSGEVMLSFNAIRRKEEHRIWLGEKE